MDKIKSDAIVGALPTEGAITYRELQHSLATAGKQNALTEFHEARREGAFEARVIDGVLIVARAGNLPARPGDPGYQA